MSNEYYDAWERVVKRGCHHYPELESLMSQVFCSKCRGRLIYEYSFAIPNDEAVAAISKLSPIVEIGAGSGYWAHLLKSAGAVVYPYDDGSWHHDWKKTWTEILPGGPEKAMLHPEATLFLCWPPMSNMAFHALSLYFGNTVAYIGEGYGGCTADDEFHEALSSDWREIESIKIPQWGGIHDDLTIWKRK